MPRAAARPFFLGYLSLVWIALAWVIGNCVYVFAFLDGARTYRIEAAVIALVAILLPVAVLPPSRHEPRVHLPRRHFLIVVATALAGWAALYLYFIDYPFLSDDYVFLNLFRRVSDLNGQPQFFRPLFAAVFWSLRTLFGVSPVPFHIVSIALHAGSALMVYRLCLMLFTANGPAILAASLFLVNPLQLEASLWISGQQELLWVFFVLAALTAYVSQHVLSARHLTLTCVCVACGLLSKETAVCCVLLLPAADILWFRLSRGRLLVVAYALFTAELIGYFALRHALKPLDPTYFVTPTRYFVKQFVAMPYRFFIHPWNRSAVHVPSMVLLLVSVTVAVLFVLAVLERRRSSPVHAGAFIMLATTLPVYSYFYVAADLMSSRYLYGAAAGWAIVLAECLATSLSKPNRFTVAALAAIVLGAGSLYLNARPWLVARDVVNSLTLAAATETGLEAELDRWRTVDPPGTTWKDGVPYSCNGVAIFVNGYNEFLQISGEERSVK